MNMKICNHGYYMHDCALCEKRPDECDYGSCTAPAIKRVQYPRESRLTCAKHAGHIESLARRVS